MIVDTSLMKDIEKNAHLSTTKLMEKAGTACASFIMSKIEISDNILIIAGKGNNGGDGSVICCLLNEAFYKCKIVYVNGDPKSKDALKMSKLLDPKWIIKPTSLKANLSKAKVIIDCVYGFGFHGPLGENDLKLFSLINKSKACVFSVDINSGCEADTSRVCPQAIKSKYTLALECYKPFHLLNKDHQMFKEVALIDLGLKPNVKTPYQEMNEETFIKLYPFKKDDAYKGCNGKPLLIGGSFGMAGACGLNIIGAQSVGSTYLSVATNEDIYPALASRFLTPVFHPFGCQTYTQVIQPLFDTCNVISYGSGCTNLSCKEPILELLLQYYTKKVVLDAEALKLLSGDTYLFKLSKPSIVITPHIKEFSDLIIKPIDVINANKLSIVSSFAKDYNVLTVLKGPNTIVASPDGRIYINQTGNKALATAGSGDLLTGMITGLMSMIDDSFTACMMAVWFHGYLADQGIKVQSKTCYDLTKTLNLADAFFYTHNQ